MAGFCTTPWRWISGILAVLCLMLMAILGIVLKNSFHKLDIEPTLSPGTTLISQEDSDCCSCQERWILYSCNCYFISSEKKTWNEILSFCVSQNSTLLQMHSRNELHFMKFSRKFFWIGATYSEKQQTWVWLNGSALSQDLSPSHKISSSKNCIVYNPNLGIQDQTCIWINLYICKQELIWYQHGGNCYFFSRKMLLWSKCFGYCADLHSSFVKVDTEEAMDFVMQLSKLQCEMRKEKFFLSLSYNSQWKKWVWFDATDYTLSKLLSLELSPWHDLDLLEQAHVSLPCMEWGISPHGRFLYHSMEVDFWDLSSIVSFVDGYSGNCVEKLWTESSRLYPEMLQGQFLAVGKNKDSELTKKMW
ncbi:secretory phospholipase A2 receptor-like [Talpa occidentalis]|uniref:secretory phospholipase A2 receptor-like n=1 Tax=Talpa occidentalis TaxID=50954 RepID=UPI0023F8685D|nr:secretory phospholipase A2 receptor-like [Talpa occidentalis]